MADVSTYLERSKMNLHIYGLLIIPQKRAMESAELAGI